MSVGKAYSANLARIGENIFDILIVKEKTNAHKTTKKGEGARVEHLAKTAKANEVKSLGKDSNNITLAQLKVIIVLLKRKEDG